jgi:hypothetical protein
MTTTLPEQPLIDIGQDNDGYNVALIMNGVKQVYRGGHNYNQALCFAQGLAAGILAWTGCSVIEAFPRSEADFCQRQSAAVEVRPT